MAGDIILQWNCVSLNTHGLDLGLLISSYSPSVICLQETRLKPNSKFNFPNYTCYFKSNADGYGGVGILVKNTILQSPVILKSNLQAIAVCVTIRGKAYIVSSIYVPPLSNPSKAEYENIISQFDKPFLLCGDFNAHSPLWGSLETNDHGDVMEELIEDNDLIPINTNDMTWHKIRCRPSLLDLSLVHPSIYLDFSFKVLDDKHHSDHSPILIYVNEGEEPDTEKTPKWNFRKADWDGFKLKCLEHINEDIFNDHTDKMEGFSATLLDIASEYIPKTTPYYKKKSKPWFDEECRTAKRERNKADRIAKRFPNMNNIMRSKLMQARARKLFRSKKRESWRQYVSSIDSRTRPTKVWNMIRKIAGKTVPNRLHHLKDSNGDLITTKSDIAEKLAQTFETNSSSEQYTHKFKMIKNREENKRLNFKTKKTYSYNKKFSLRDLKRSLKKSNDSSPGVDQIHYQILKHLPNESLKFLLNLINEYWETGTFPECWRTALLLPIPKPGKNHYDANNYRPIALTSCICKTVERMVNERLMWVLEKKGLLSKLQCGFRKGRGTIDQLVRMESFVRDAFANKDHLVAVFFDLQKAYDTTWKHGIMQDLYEMGFRGNLPIFIQNFLCDRVFLVLYGNVLSDEYSQEEGVPQGAILSTTLFNVKLNGIVKAILPGVECSLYVDDFVIVFRSSSIPTIERTLQLCINSIIEWTIKNGFTISANKTVAMHFCQKKKGNYDPVLKLGESTIEFVKENKFLGLIWDTKLTFKPHIQYLRKKCFKVLNIIKVLSHQEWGADTNTLLKLYQSLVRSKVDYGSIVYRNADEKSVLKSLEVIHNQGLRLCLGAFKSSPLESLNVEANVYPLKFRRRRLGLQYGVKVKSNKDNIAYPTIFYHTNPELYDDNRNIKPFAYDFKHECEQANMSLHDILSTGVPSIPVWDSPSIDVSFELTEFDKRSTTSDIFLSKFREILPKYDGYCKIYTDGSKCNERTAAAFHSPFGTRSFRISDSASIFTAEIQALRSALNFIRISWMSKFVIFSDSKSALESINIQDSDNSLVMNTLHDIYELSKKHKVVKFCWIPSHVGIPGNEIADRAAKSALNFATPVLFQVPYTDKYPTIKHYISTCWQQEWDNNSNQKLYEMMPRVDKFNVNALKRKEQVVIHRIRIGHTRLTHSFLMEGRPNPPQCTTCNDELTVKHFMLHCRKYTHIRSRFYNVQNMLELFETVSLRTIITYIKEIGVFNEL